jgi:hypothetical protein
MSEIAQAQGLLAQVAQQSHLRWLSRTADYRFAPRAERR